MKRILALILVLVLCVGSFASCAVVDKVKGMFDKDEGTKYDVEGAAGYLYTSQLKDMAGKETPNDFDLVAKVVRDGVTYIVTWTSDNANVTIDESSKGSSFVTVNVPENNDTAFTYKLTATVKGPDGKEATKEVTLTVPVVKAEEGVVKAPVEGVAYKLNINQKALERNIYALSTFKSGKLEATNDPKQATDYFVEVTDGGYYIYAMVSGAKKYLSFAKVPNPNGGYYDNVVYTDNATSVWAYDSEYSVWYVTYEAATFGLGAYSTNEAFGVSGINFFRDEDKKDGQYPAKFMTKEYAETLEPEEGIVGPEELPKDTLLTLAQASEFALKFVHNNYSDNKYYVEGKITNIDNSKGYGNLIIADDNGGSLTIYGSYINGVKYGDQDIELKVGDVVKVYGRLGQYNNVAQMKNGDVVLINGKEPEKAPSVEITVEEFLAMAFALEVGAEQTGPFTFDGVVSGHSDDSYKNVIVVLGGQTDKALLCYRVTDERLTVGTTFNFTAGKVKNYNGTVEFMDVVINSINGVAEQLPTVPENYTGAQLVDAIYQLKNGQTLTGPYTLTGVVSEITEAYSSNFGNATFTIIVDGLTDKPILCYRIKGEKADGLAVGDTVTVTGAFTNYGGKFETVQGEAQVTNVVKGTGSGGNTGSGDVDTPITDIPDNCPLVENTGYVLSVQNANGALYFNGVMGTGNSAGRFMGSTDIADAVLVYYEKVTTSGYRLYFMDGQTKTYISMEDKAAGGSFGTDADSATVFLWNTTLNTFVVADPDNARAFGAQDSSTYANMSAYAISNTTGYNFGVFTLPA